MIYQSLALGYKQNCLKGQGNEIEFKYMDKNEDFMHEGIKRIRTFY
jgi:hypothetical protein